MFGLGTLILEGPCINLLEVFEGRGGGGKERGGTGSGEIYNRKYTGPRIKTAVFYLRGPSFPFKSREKKVQ